MEFTDIKSQRLIKIKEEESCTDVNTEMNNTAYMKIKTEYSHSEFEINSASDKIKPVLENNVKKEEMVFEDASYKTSEVAYSSCNNYTSQLQTVEAQFELNQPNHVSDEIKTDIPFYFTDSMNLKNDINHETRTNEVNVQYNQLGTWDYIFLKVWIFQARMESRQALASI